MANRAVRVFVQQARTGAWINSVRVANSIPAPRRQQTAQWSGPLIRWLREVQNAGVGKVAVITLEVLAYSKHVLSRSCKNGVKNRIPVDHEDDSTDI